ncbi:hypothetical protein CBOM_07758 [Ceraceosorus bombacis]|uniref:Uncharacterized protein n=1 Tax=Ceraceosorus bombacis TaxID=401625 RepID=A0A0P1BN70_9BASI|nr:hypothetical protein CBOM_07758 [Ceraceosorus bombacis]
MHDGSWPTVALHMIAPIIFASRNAIDAELSESQKRVDVEYYFQTRANFRLRSPLEAVRCASSISSCSLESAQQERDWVDGWADGPSTRALCPSEEASSAPARLLRGEDKVCFQQAASKHSEL